MDEPSDDEDEEGEEPADDSNWAKSDDDDSGEKEPTTLDMTSDIPSTKDDEDDDLIIPSSGNFKLLFSKLSGEYWIDNNGVKTQVPTKYYSIASDKSKKGSEKAAKISALMARDSENVLDMDSEEDEEM